MIKLIETINACINGSSYIIGAKIDRALDIFYRKTLKRNVSKLKKDKELLDKRIIANATSQAHDLDDKIFEDEVFDVLKNMDIDNSTKECLREYILNRRTYADIAKDYSKAEETVRQKVKKETKYISRYYK